MRYDAAMTLAPDNIDDVRRDLGRGLDLIASKREDYLEARDYYVGMRAEIAASKKVRKLIDQSGNPHPVSLAHIPVDALMDKVELSSLKASDTQADALLTALWDSADLEDEADDWHRKAGYFGDYYVIVDVTEERPDGVATLVTPIGSSPLTTVVIYDSFNRPLYGVKRWQQGKTWEALVYYDDVTIKLATSETGSESPKAQDYDFLVDETGEQASAYIAHPGGKMLIIHYAVDDKPYGRPVHQKAFGPQDAITKVSAVNLANVDGQGFGARYALADPMAEIDDDIDDDFGTDGPTSKAGDKSYTALTNATSGSSVSSEPGSIALLKGIKSVDQFDATTSDDFIKNLDWYTRVMATACRVPMFEFDPESGSQISGIARLRAEAPLTRHAKKVQRAVGNAHKTLADTVLAVSGIDPLTAEVAVTFRPTEVMNDVEGMQLISAKVKAGLPIRQAFSEAGYSDEQIDEWFPEGEPNVSLDALQVLAAALQQLGQAHTLGVISEEDLRAILPNVLTTVIAEGPAPAPVAVPPAVPVIPSA
jgi:hypothetical protein